MIVTAKPSERKSVLEEAAGISGIHMRRHEAETRLNAAENNLKRADELKRQQEKQLDNLKKQAEEATKYREISEKIKSSEAALYYLKIQNIEKEKSQLKEQSSDINTNINSLKNNIDRTNTLLEEEKKRLQPLKDKKIENLSKLQKINLDISNLQKEEERVKELNKKIQNNLNTIDSDLEREKSISLDASLNEKRMLEEKNELLKTEKELFEIENKSKLDLELSSGKLKELLNKLDNLLSEIGTYIETDRKLSKEIFEELKGIINKITSSQEEYAIYFGKNESIKSDSIKRKERINNIDQELENWKDLKLNSEKMILDLTERRKKLSNELEESQKDPEKIAISKGQNLQNLENTKKQSEELEVEINAAENKFNSIDGESKSLQEKFAVLRENKARFEATIEGIDQRKMDLIYVIKKELKIENINNLFSITGFTDPEKLPSIDEQESTLAELKKSREALGSVNLRADLETEKFKVTIKKMEDDRADLISAIVKLKSSINELNQKGRERLLDAFSKINKKFNEVYVKLFNGGNAKLELVDSDDPLEAGLEMLVSPPGKRLQSITLLSGGEQALTALSLVFAIFLTNPSPICVLDEVDAPLDDANVTRFCSLLEELTTITKTKFIIITHHALTMSKMNRLYGVTMPEKGISKLVAVNLERAEELVA